jgi:predicted CoA-binding protein
MKNTKIFLFITVMTTAAQSLFAQPEVPVEEWTGKTVMFIGAHPDDDARAHGTMAMLQDHGNEVYVVIITS